MTVGIQATNLASKWLNILNGTAFPSVPSALYTQLHTADPTAAGTTGISAYGGATRKVTTLSTSTAGSQLTLSNTPSWTFTGTETIGWISVWDAVTAGNFLFDAVLNISKTVNSGDTLNLTSLTFSIGVQAV